MAEEKQKIESGTERGKQMGTGKPNSLLENLNRLHTTDLGAARIRKNLSLDTGDVTGWCRDKIQSPEAVIDRVGKNWYVDAGDCVITVNAHSYTIITAHKNKKARYHGNGENRQIGRNGKKEETGENSGAGKRLEAFEKMLAGIQERYEDTKRKMDEMKAGGKTKSATYRQFMGTKMMYRNMLSMYRLYGLLEDDPDETESGE